MRETLRQTARRSTTDHRTDSKEEPAAELLIVDDDAAVLEVLRKMLTGHHWNITTAGNPGEALARLAKHSYDLLLCDVNMPPGRGGLELVRAAHGRFADMATIMISGDDDLAVGQEALELGAFGYLVKPVSQNEIVINVSNALHRRRLRLENRAYQHNLQQAVVDRTKELLDTIEQLEFAERQLRGSHYEAIERLTRAAEYRDDQTGQHLQRMSRYCTLLGARTGMSKDECDLLRSASPMHDIGKVGIPDEVLLKPGKLSAAERDIMRRHPEIGFRILSGSKSPLMQMASTIAISHHEKFDGSGYPRGVTGERIPLTGRIVAIADVFDALTSVRVYKPALSTDQASEIMHNVMTGHFDPGLLSAFFGAIDEVLLIKDRFSEEQQHGGTSLHSFP
ncbi:MAG: response regulator [Candidatus Lambdaproteobacteria bacterium]|nr:response regulator [Candidatus Lambdaproteobacteria bacterium]